MAKKPLPTPETLRQLLRYEPETGKLFWKERPMEMFADSKRGAKTQCDTWNSRHAGKEAFTNTSKYGYRRGIVLNQNHQAHRVIWAIAYGEWPAQDVDHINRNRADNRLSNLRLASRSENLSNIGARAGGTSSFLGVSWSAANKGWIAQMRWKKRHFYLGTFSTEEAAARAYDEAALREKGEFATTNFTRGHEHVVYHR